MNSFAPLKTALVSSVFALSAFVSHATASTLGELREKPICDLDFLITETLKDDSIVPTGLKASSEKWDMEIYSNGKSGEWVLVGKSKAPLAKGKNPELCQLAWGKAPYTQTSWYQQNFSSPATKLEK